MQDILKRTWAEIDLDALRHNFNIVRENTSKDAALCCVIKADAYGHGAVRVGRLFEELGADYLAVSNLEEALQLRAGGVKQNILILGYTPANHAKDLSENGIAQCVYSEEYAAELSRNALESSVTVKVHIKIDTGMSRLGFDLNYTSESEIESILRVCKLPALDFEGVFTHFAVSDEGEKGKDFTTEQYKRFKALLYRLSREGITFKIRHCANSAGILDYLETHMDMVRAGIILYGLYPSGCTGNRPLLKPALELKSVVSHLKTVHEGYTVSYGREYTASRDTKIATIPIGYADGYPRILGARNAELLINGKRCKITGRICMDQLMADVSELKNVKVGDSVVLIGRSGDEKILADEIAGYQDSINYEVVCDIGKRVPRIYLKGSEIESISNQILPPNKSFA